MVETNLNEPYQRPALLRPCKSAVPSLKTKNGPTFSGRPLRLFAEPDYAFASVAAGLFFSAFLAILTR
jgi:hypothetical protein